MCEVRTLSLVVGDSTLDDVHIHSPVEPVLGVRDEVLTEAVDRRGSTSRQAAYNRQRGVPRSKGACRQPHIQSRLRKIRGQFVWRDLGSDPRESFECNDRHARIVLRKKEYALSFSATYEPRQFFAATLGPHHECLGCSFPLATVCLHADGRALEIA